MFVIIEKLDGKEISRNNISHSIHPSLEIEKHCRDIAAWIDEDKNGELIAWKGQTILFRFENKLHLYQCTLIEEEQDTDLLDYQKRLYKTRETVIKEKKKKKYLVERLNKLQNLLSVYEKRIDNLYSLYCECFSIVLMASLIDEITEAAVLVLKFVEELNLSSDEKIKQLYQFENKNNNPNAIVHETYYKFKDIVLEIKNLYQKEKYVLCALEKLEKRLDTFPIKI